VTPENAVDKAPVRYVWTERDIEAQPVMGTLAEYARSREMAHLSGAYVVSESVWTCDEQGQLVEHPVKVERGQMTDNYRIPMEYQANDETVIYFADGAA
jgi:hypothetical protein